jgi:hypothetical protein
MNVNKVSMENTEISKQSTLGILKVRSEISKYVRPARPACPLNSYLYELKSITTKNTSNHAASSAIPFTKAAPISPI